MRGKGEARKGRYCTRLGGKLQGKSAMQLGSWSVYTVRITLEGQRYKAQVQYFGAEFRVRFVPVQYHTIIATTGNRAGKERMG